MGPTSRVLALPLTLGLLASSACGGSVQNGGGSETDSGASDDGGGAQGDAAFDGQPEANPGMVAVPLFACLPIVYTAAVTVGESQQFQMNIDTGSTTLGVASNKCSNCGVTPEYTPGSSATDQHKTGQSQYGIGQWSGEIYKDTVALTPASPTPVSFVAIDSQMNFFQQIQCDSKSGSLQGILGLGPSATALPGTNGYFDEFIVANQVPDVFATQLCDKGGTLWLGGYDPSFTTAPPQYVPMLGGQIGQLYYAVNLTSVEANGTTVTVATSQSLGSVVDTGTSGFLLPPTPYDALAGAIQSSPGFKKVFGGSFFPTSAQFLSGQPPVPCTTVTATKAAIDAALPALTLTFGGVSVKALPTESYLFSAQVSPGQSYWCSGLLTTDPSQIGPLSAIIGAPVLRSNIVIWDRAQNRVGFAPQKACP